MRTSIPVTTFPELVLYWNYIARSLEQDLLRTIFQKQIQKYDEN